MSWITVVFVHISVLYTGTIESCRSYEALVKLSIQLDTIGVPCVWICQRTGQIKVITPVGS